MGFHRHEAQAVTISVLPGNNLGRHGATHLAPSKPQCKRAAELRAQRENKDARLGLIRSKGLSVPVSALPRDVWSA